MLAHDFDRFCALIKQMEGVYSKKFGEETLRLWWSALRDMPFEQVQERVNSHIRYSKFLPKPADIRPKDDRPKEKRDDASFQEGIRRSNENLDELWHKDHARWLEVVSPRIYELGRAKGMLDGQIAEKLRDYKPCSGRVTN